MIDPQNLIHRHLKRRSPLSDLLSPLGQLNAFLQIQRRKRLSPKAWHPPCPVISIGNIVSGGSGKTPFTIYLAGLLGASGCKVAISHRGYKGRLENTPTLISDRERILFGATDAGDEALLIAKRLPGIPVAVGKQRVAAVSLLLAKYPDLDVLLLDDAFQHLGIARDLDIVCFDADLGCGNGRLIPAGYLREPVSALASASLLVVTNKHASSGSETIAGCWDAFAKPVFHCRLQARDGMDAEGRSVELGSLAGKKLLLISGIADPDSFENSVKALGLSWLHHFRYPDHYTFRESMEAQRIAQIAAKYSADILLCTEKDLAKLASHAELRDKLLALRMDLACEDGDGLKELLRQQLGL
ncbi:MAG: tetraacyldisaccharide 4'-kinase [Candidatus Cloacimonetes bacterium]|nr:tetraacyldisaccharide 4'-kinase [Candidatus Cloacimonadota bacterium]